MGYSRKESGREEQIQTLSATKNQSREGWRRGGVGCASSHEERPRKQENRINCFSRSGRERRRR